MLNAPRNVGLVLALMVMAFSGWVLACELIFGTGLAERDGYFHARYAQMFFQRGLDRQFPWTQASIWRDHFCDKEFLYHAGMAAYALGERTRAAKHLEAFIAIYHENDGWRENGLAVLRRLRAPTLGS